jgi:hypothetical protein
MKSIKRRIAEYKIKRRKHHPTLTGLLNMALGMIFFAVSLNMFNFNSESTYRGYYERWKEPVFHWLLKREHEGKDVPAILMDMAWEKLLFYRQIEAEIGYEY